MNKPRLILLAAQGHSGTTILDAALGCSPFVTGMGEALRLFNPEITSAPIRQRILDGRRSNVLCSCGRTADHCPIWSTFTAEVIRSGDLAARMQDLHDLAIGLEPRTRYLLDSTPNGLRYADRLGDFDLRVIRLVRDVRSWTASDRRRTGDSAISSYRKWREKTLKLENQVAATGLPFFALGYEEFALRPELVLRKLCDWLEIPFETSMLSPLSKTGSHIVTGNRSIRDRGRASAIQYDASWIVNGDRSWLEYLLYTRVAAQNARLVYSNDIIRAGA